MIYCIAYNTRPTLRNLRNDDGRSVDSGAPPLVFAEKDAASDVPDYEGGVVRACLSQEPKLRPPTWIIVQMLDDETDNCRAPELLRQQYDDVYEFVGYGNYSKQPPVQYYGMSITCSVCGDLASELYFH